LRRYYQHALNTDAIGTIVMNGHYDRRRNNHVHLTWTSMYVTLNSSHRYIGWPHRMMCPNSAPLPWPWPRPR
jgi:hypothetical protein